MKNVVEKDKPENGCSVVGSVFAESVAGYIKIAVGAVGSTNAKTSTGAVLARGGDSEVSLR
jgi:hypothetical protein